jgi:hypothetical protein
MFHKNLFAASLIIVIVGGSGQQNLEIQLLPDSFGRPSIEISFEGVTPSFHRLPIYFGGPLMVHANSLSNNTDYFNATIQSTNITMTYFRNDRSFIPMRLPRWGRIGIGQNSRLLMFHDTITVVQNATHPITLTLGSTREYFANSCLDNDDGIIKAGLDLQHFNRFWGSVWFADEPAPLSRYSRIESIKFASQIDSMDSAILLDDVLLDRVAARMAANGIRLRSRGVFQNCTEIPPGIDLVLYTYRNADGSGIGRIEIPAGDYVQVDVSAGTCTVRIAGGNIPVFNPLKIPGMNIRLTEFDNEDSGTVAFCDSAF